ncbi:hypothetical protein [Vibrio campbellii]|uniref:hypothetical protein n=1 Tax=Vibrio campbellii TaxID=680 RepID=UPI001F2F71AC|nr:hypothetical protein [Vibrio campbellii]MCE7729353.1 hypothetical protein [Vibrio campbellii]
MAKKNPFRNYQINKVSTRTNKVEEALEIISSDGIKFRNITSLAKNIASIVYQLELEEYANSEKIKSQFKTGTNEKPKKMAYTTLTRNENYRVLLLAQLSKENKLANFEKESASIPQQALIAKKNVQILNLKNTIEVLEQKQDEQSHLIEENIRLKNFVENFYSGSGGINNLIENNSTNNHQNSHESLETIKRQENDISDLVKIVLLIEKFCEYIEIDYEKRRILDKTKMGSRQAIVQGELLNTFFGHTNMLKTGLTSEND